jgi:hypothetical protein
VARTGRLAGVVEKLTVRDTLAGGCEDAQCTAFEGSATRLRVGPDARRWAMRVTGGRSSLVAFRLRLRPTADRVRESLFGSLPVSRRAHARPLRAAGARHRGVPGAKRSCSSPGATRTAPEPRRRLGRRGRRVVRATRWALRRLARGRPATWWRPTLRRRRGGARGARVAQGIWRPADVRRAAGVILFD